MADDAEARQDHDVNFRMAEEPEQVLEQQRIAAGFRLEERAAEITVDQQHGDAARQNRQRQQQQKRGDQHRPHEQRHAEQRHARRAHVEDGGDEVERAQDRARTGKVQRENGKIDGRARLADIGERRIQSPRGAGAAADHGGGDQQRKAGNSQPEADTLLRRGNAMSGAPIIKGTNQLPKPPIRPGMMVKKIMIRPCAVMITFQSWPSLT